MSETLILSIGMLFVTVFNTATFIIIARGMAELRGEIEKLKEKK